MSENQAAKGASASPLMTSTSFPSDTHSTFFPRSLNDAQLGFLFDSAQLGLWDWEPLTGNIIANTCCKALLGYTETELKNINLNWWTARVHPSQINEFKRGLETFLQSGSSTFCYEVRARHKEGHWVWMRGSGVIAERTAEGKASRVTGTFQNISPHKQTFQRLERQQAMLEAMSQQGRIGAWEFDIERNRLYWSSMTREIHEVADSFEPDVNSGIYFYKEGYSRDRITEVVKKGIEEGEPWHEELQIVTAKGKELWVAALGKPVVENGQVVRLYGSFQDVDARVKTQAALQKAKEDAESATKAKSEFLAVMSHEIRTPLNGVMGMLNLLQHGDLDSQQRRKVDIASNSAESLLHIINDILDFSKADAGKMSIDEREFDLRVLIDEVLESSALKAQEKGVTLLLNQAQLSVSRVIGDETRLRQLLVNLLGNAVKFTGEGSVHVTAHMPLSSEPVLSVAIEDTGIGIPRERIDSIFEPFVQADLSTTRKHGGTGLGLAICKQLCTLLGGSIEAESKEGVGSTFRFNIPLKVADHEAAKALFEKEKALLETVHVYLIEPEARTRSVLNEELLGLGATVEVYDSIEAYSLNAAEIDARGRNVVLLAGDCSELGRYEVCLKNGNERIGAIGEPSDVPCDTKFFLMHPMGDSHSVESISDSTLFSGFLPKPICRKDLEQVAQSFFDRGNDISAVNQNSKQALNTQEKILLVEDNEINQEVALMLLEDLGKTVDVANNGAEALEMLKAAPVDAPYTLVLMDCQMPVMDGYEATLAIREGRAGEAYKSIAIAAMTANALAGDRERCLRSGMDDYIPKPIEEERIIECLERFQAKN